MDITGTRPGGVSGIAGRRRELDGIGQAIHEAVAGRGRALFLTGEPGIGKSRVAEEGAALARAAGATVARGRCWDAGGAPAFWPWIQMMRTLGALPDSPGLEPLSAAPVYLEELRGEARSELFDRVRAALDAFCVQTPLVLLIEDLHAGDLATLELVRAVAAHASRTRLLLIGTFREAEADLDPETSRLLGTLVREGEVLRLEGLAEEELAELVRARFRDRTRDSVVPVLRRMTGGNPLFLEEILATVGEDGPLDESRLVNLRLPEHVREMIVRRLSSLPERSQALLATASVIGPEFDRDVLAATETGTGDDIAAPLAAAEAAGIVRTDPESPRRCAFVHDLFRETLYRGLSADDRLRLHAAVGLALERQTGDRRSHADLAYHFVQAAPVHGRDRAVRYSQIAGREAMAQLAWESASRHFEDALALAELPPEEPPAYRCGLLLELGVATWAFGAFERSKRAFRSAARLAREASDPEMLARAALGTSGHAVFLDMGAGGVDEPRTGLLAKALDVLPREDSPLRARLLARLCAALSLTPDVERRRALATEAVAMARRLGKQDALCDVLHATSWGRWDPDALDERLRVSEEVLALARRTGREGVAQLTHYRRLHHFLEAADAGAARRELEASRRSVEALPQAFFQWVNALREAVWATASGRFVTAEEHAREALRVGQEDQNPNAFRLFVIQGVFVLRELGRLDEIVSHVESIVAALPEFAAWRSALAWTYAELGRRDDARRELEVLTRDDLGHIPRDLYWLAALWGASETCLALEDRRRAHGLYRALAPFEDRCLVVYSGAFGGAIARILGGLAGLLRRFDVAAAHFVTARRIHERMGARSWAAHSGFEEARMRLRRGRRADRERAADLLAAAREEAEALGMTALAARIETLRTTGGTTRRSRSVGNVFRLDGEFWTIRWQGKRVAVPDAKGFHYLAKLLASPGSEIHVLELAGAETPDTPSRPRGGESQGMATAPGLGDAGEVLDARAAASYRARHRDLEAMLEGATGRRAREIREEMDFLSRELDTSRGLGGRRRRAADPADRARKAVTSRIRHALARIESSHASLARHLTASLRLGTFCSYAPRQTPRWDL